MPPRARPVPAITAATTRPRRTAAVYAVNYHETPYQRPRPRQRRPRAPVVPPPPPPSPPPSPTPSSEDLPPRRIHRRITLPPGMDPPCNPETGSPLLSWSAFSSSSPSPEPTDASSDSSSESEVSPIKSEQVSTMKSEQVSSIKPEPVSPSSSKRARTMRTTWICNVCGMMGHFPTDAVCPGHN